MRQNIFECGDGHGVARWNVGVIDVNYGATDVKCGAMWNVAISDMVRMKLQLCGVWRCGMWCPGRCNVS